MVTRPPRVWRHGKRSSRRKRRCLVLAGPAPASKNAHFWRLCDGSPGLWTWCAEVGGGRLRLRLRLRLLWLGMLWLRMPGVVNAWLCLRDAQS